MLERFLKLLYQVHFLRGFLSKFLSVEQRRLHLRHSIKQLENVNFSVTCDRIIDHRFYLKDISLGGLAFILDSNEQTSVFKPGSIAVATLIFKEQTFTGNFRVAYTRNGMIGCQVLSKKIEYKKFVTEKMGDLLVQSSELN